MGKVLSSSKELPTCVVRRSRTYPEDIRLKYRFLDLRRESLHKNIVQRTKIIAEMRKLMGETGFTEYSTPILTASSPEGARDFLVPSRLHEGKFYALPQAPQIYKQLIMVSGFDRYFQIAPCFRDEDPRADRLPGEFYQLDLEMSFVEQEDVLATMEPVMRGVFEAFAAGKPVTPNFRRIAYDDAIRTYGSKADLESHRDAGPSPSIPAARASRSSPNILSQRRRGAGLGNSGQDRRLPRASANQHELVGSREKGQPGAGLTSSGARNREAYEGLRPDRQEHRRGARGKPVRLQLALGSSSMPAFLWPPATEKISRPSRAGRTARRAGRGAEPGRPASVSSSAGIVDFPFYEWDEDEKKIEFAHNPFSMPQGGMEGLAGRRPAGAEGLPVRFSSATVLRSRRAASATILPEVMGQGVSRRSVLMPPPSRNVLGASTAPSEYGAPPHGGMAAASTAS